MSTAPVPRLRLVGGRPIGEAAAAAPEDAVRRENRRAAFDPPMAADDPRWVLATRAWSQLEGSVLTPDRRERVLATARRLGVQPFEANVIIAVVQDRARRRGALAETLPTLALLGAAPEPPIAARTIALRGAALLLAGVALAALLALWIAG